MEAFFIALMAAVVLATGYVATLVLYKLNRADNRADNRASGAGDRSS